MHWLLAAGPYNVVTFGEIEEGTLRVLNYGLVPRAVMIESPGVLDGTYDTAVNKGSRGRIVSHEEFMRALIPDGRMDYIDPESQTAFPLYYREDTFRATRQPTSYLRHVLGRFLWKLQSGVCPQCGLDTRYALEEMHVDHIVPIDRGGNNTLLNTEMKCRMHNLKKSARLSETHDYITVMKSISDLAGSPGQGLRALFSLEASALAFPVQIRQMVR
jgi:hypothetical protein